MAGQAVRLCNGCRRGECPNLAIKTKIRQQLDTENKGESSKIEKFQMKFAAKLEEAVSTVLSDSQNNSCVINLLRGSYYGENGMPKRSGNKPLSVSGYFELYNKTNEVIAIKLLKSVENQKFEYPRPSYYTIPPRDAVYGFFSPDEPEIHLVILHDNPNTIPTDKAVLYDTRAPGASPDRISLSARIDQFQRIQVYHIPSQGKNVLLKYKGLGLMEPRNGNTLDRVGWMGRFQGRRFTDGKIDYETNVTSMSIGYSLNTSPATVS